MYTHYEKIRSLMRELNLRTANYPSAIADGSMRASEASRYLAIWERIVYEYYRQNIWESLPPEYAAEEMVAELEREITIRKVIYPHLVSAGKMTEAEMQYQVAVLEAVREDYAKEISVKQVTEPIAA